MGVEAKYCEEKRRDRHSVTIKAQASHKLLDTLYTVVGLLLCDNETEESSGAHESANYHQLSLHTRARYPNRTIVSECSQSRNVE